MHRESHDGISNKKFSCRKDRAMFHVIEYFAKSLEVNQNDTFECDMWKFLFVFRRLLPF